LGFWFWVFGFGVWGFGQNPQSPIPNPQSPIPIPNLILIKQYLKLNINKYIFKFKTPKKF